ncbi:MAG: hypothetical protein ACTSRS_06600 [Candidatus Helarchaeota archaeon]
MTFLISEIWIINEAGLPLFNRSQEICVDPSLFAGFLGAIQSFIKATFHENHIDSLTIGQHKISFLYEKEFHIYIIIRTAREAPDEEIRKSLEKIRRLFISKYGDQIQITPVEMTRFKDFDRDLQRELREKIFAATKTDWLEEI